MAVAAKIDINTTSYYRKDPPFFVSLPALCPKFSERQKENSFISVAKSFSKKSGRRKLNISWKGGDVLDRSPSIHFSALPFIKKPQLSLLLLDS
ncbi:hypothetical protein KFK09_012650 [Dendrobium nobile]|uniref:Uncharacterized protein n=1 Tax=Dendrobium nobile TaxID=94219 RepID=A0A8T3BG49_DENNO|nr:hypothetical protein KFK09_012650 [Dendrobium nobile]